MKKEKLSLSGIKNVLSRAELKKIMAGSSNRCDYCGAGGYVCCACYFNGHLSLKGAYCHDTCAGFCQTGFDTQQLSCASCL
ncbi:hypothetical protein ACFFGT_05260 [Mucilaginibacter angelicae]|uniref:Bacteriocin n=1 Tax=Mucilaginibacter angelicae TaxID=869718 RepID=A0ABV6L1R1_9SPHI